MSKLTCFALVCLLVGTVLGYPQYQQVPAQYLQQAQPQRFIQYTGGPQPSVTPIKEDNSADNQPTSQFLPGTPQQISRSPVDRQIQQSLQQQFGHPVQPQYRLVPQPQAQPAPQPQTAVRYVAAPQPAAPRQRIPQLKSPLQQQEPEEYNEPPQPYSFGFDVQDDEFTNYQNRKEQREGDKITGSYSVVDADGFLRTVTYTADPKEGFKAEVNRQPTNIVVKFPAPQPTEPRGGLRQQQIQQYLEASRPVGGIPASQKQRIVYQQQQ